MKSKLLCLFLSLLSPNLKAKNITFMFFNVENFFDWKHDKGKQDWTYLPSHHPLKTKCRLIKIPHYRKTCYRTDWTQKKFQEKLNEIKKSILSYNGRAPGILALSEVENKNVLRSIALELGYKKFYITNNIDQRGIDQALLLKEEIKVLHKSEIRSPRLSRSVLKIILNFNEPLVVYVNHWPSQMNHLSKRYEAAHLVAGDIEKNQYKKVIVVGDFNSEENLAGYFAKKAKLIDLHQNFARTYRLEASLMAPGSYFYKKKMSWKKFDRVFYSRSLALSKKIRLLKNSYQIVANRETTEVYKYDDPKSFFYGSSLSKVPGKGSDHFPIAFELRIKDR